MVRRVGFKFGNFWRPAFRHSTNSVESCEPQNSRSWSSDRNSGTALFFAISIRDPFISIHIPNRDHPEQTAAHGEGGEQISSGACLAECIIPLLEHLVLYVAANNQRLIEEDILRF